MALGRAHRGSTDEHVADPDRTHDHDHPERRDIERNDNNPAAGLMGDAPGPTAQRNNNDGNDDQTKDRGDPDPDDLLTAHPTAHQREAAGHR